MSNITIQHITPRHFYEAVKLLKQTEHNIRFSYDTVEIRFVFEIGNCRTDSSKI